MFSRIRTRKIDKTKLIIVDIHIYYCEDEYRRHIIFIKFKEK